MKTPTSLLVCAVTLLAACGDSAMEARERQIENIAAQHGLDADVTLDSLRGVDGVSVTTASGARAGHGLALPGDFPEDVYVAGDWNITVVAPVAASGGHSLHAMTDEDAAAIVASLRQAMPAGGWAEAAYEQPAPQMTRIGFRKDGRMASYVVIAAGPKHMVQLVTMPQPS